jgi:hypothetical protein
MKEYFFDIRDATGTDHRCHRNYVASSEHFPAILCLSKKCDDSERALGYLVQMLMRKIRPGYGLGFTLDQKAATAARSIIEEEEKKGRKARLSLVQAELEAIIAKQSESGRWTRKVDHQNTDLEWSAVTDDFDAVEWESLCEKGRRIMRLE